MKGSYILLIELPCDREIEVGRLGKIRFRKGFYAYVGSALNSIESRVKRHLRREKKLFWHIDYLLTEADVREVVYIESNEKVECEIAKKFIGLFKSVKGFGCSDCGCRSHLFYSHNLNDLRWIT